MKKFAKHWEKNKFFKNLIDSFETHISKTVDMSEKVFYIRSEPFFTNKITDIFELKIILTINVFIINLEKARSAQNICPPLSSENHHILTRSETESESRCGFSDFVGRT